MKVLHINDLNQVAILQDNQLHFYTDSELEPIDSISISCYNPDFVMVNKDYLVTTSDSRTALIFQLSTRQHIHTIRTKSKITGTDFTPYLGLVLATENGDLVIGDVTIEAASNHHVVALAASPCGSGILAVAYSSGELVIYQVTQEHKLQQLHSITCYQIQDIAWHFSCSDLSRQSLAVLLNDRILVWSINIASAVKKIRDITVPQGFKPNYDGSGNFLKWCKGGKVVRTINSGIMLADVKTKNVKTATIPINDISAIDIHSPTSRAWCLLQDEELRLYDLVNGTLQESIRLKECATICESPMVRLTNVSGQVNKITIKKSPKQHRKRKSNNLFKPQYRESFDFTNSEEDSPILTPTRGFSVDSVSTFDSPATPTTSGQTDSSLFPDVMARLLWQPKAVLPYVSGSKEKYLVQSLFGIEYESIRQVADEYSVFGDDFGCHSNPVHRSAGVHCKLGQPHRAVATYLRHGFYLEALSVALLHQLEWMGIFQDWISHASEEKQTLQSISSQLDHEHRNSVAVTPTKLHFSIPNYSRPTASAAV